MPDSADGCRQLAVSHAAHPHHDANVFTSNFILDQLTGDVDWASCPGRDIAPWQGIHRGRAEVPIFFKALGDTLPYVTQAAQVDQPRAC